MKKELFALSHEVVKLVGHAAFLAVLVFAIIYK